MQQPRGLRNCNPLNIRHSRIKWIGMTEKQTDKAFVTFKNLTYGFRAAFIVIRTYMLKHGLTTIEQIINRWAPPSENDTNTYIRIVSDVTGIDRFETLNFYDEHSIVSLVQAMAYVENDRFISKRESMTEAYKMVVDEQA